MNNLKRFTEIDYLKINALISGLPENRNFTESEAHHSYYYHQGDLEIEGNFELDCHDVVVIEGDLSVHGIVQDEYLAGNEINMMCINDYSIVYVLGSLSAEHFISGSFFYTKGDFRVNGTIYLNSLGIDVLHVGGGITSDYFINEGHMVVCSDLKTNHLIVSEEYSDEYEKNTNKVIITEDIFKDKSIYYHNRIDPEILYKKLIIGEDIFTF